MKDTRWLVTDGHAWIPMNVQLALTIASKGVSMFSWEVALRATVSQAIYSIPTTTHVAVSPKLIMLALNL